MRQLDTHLAVESINGVETIVCRHCGEELCGADQNYKLHIIRDTKRMEDAGPKMNIPEDFVDESVEFRQYYCPGCATLLENEVILEEISPIQDKSLHETG